MCGICGIWNYQSKQPVDRDHLRSMTDTLQHRGPDDSGLYFDDSYGMGLGFRRLAIIDLSSAGHQPMSNEDGSVWTAFNGEIYNFQDLRPALEARGHIFRSHTDTEVILHHYEEYGTECVRDLFGMFGLAIWDGRRPQLMLARDRIGKKPLYYYDDGQRLIFASELKAILHDRSIPRQLNYSAVAEYLSLGYIGSPRTIINGIAKLPPAHILVHQGTQSDPWRYWDWLPAFQTNDTLSEAEWIERLRAVLREAVRVRMISDVPLGAFLSGGVDSSAVVATMAGLSDRPVNTFSIGFEDQRYNELPYARQVAQHFGTNHHEYIVQPENAIDLLPLIAHQLDEPFSDSSVLPTYYVSKIARQEVTVCLSGDGGDEAIAGYDRYIQTLQEQWVDLIPRTLRTATLSLPAALLPDHKRGRRLAHRLMLAEDQRYAFGMQNFYAAQARNVLSPNIARYVKQVPQFLETYQQRGAHLDYLSRIQYLDSTTYLPEDILVKVDRTSMMNGLETRCPLLDHRFLELTASIPPQLRIKNHTGKYIFKQALRGLVPDSIINRPKKGFGIPGQHWFTGDVYSFAREVLSERAVIQRGIFQAPVVNDLLGKNRAIGSVLWPQIWSLLIFELWCRAYLDG